LPVAMKPGAYASAELVRADVLVLLREKRYEDALALLYRARSEAPDSAELQKSIEQVKEFLIGAYAKRLGGLDRVAMPIAPAAGRSPDVVLLSRYIDGTSTYGDLAQMCPLGRLRTLQVLADLYPRQGSPPTPRAVSEPDVPHSGPRPLPAEGITGHAEISAFGERHEERPPDTARSPSSLPVAPAPAIETADDRDYREAFARGTAAYIQRRFGDAMAAFEACLSLRPQDGAAEVMLRRSRRDFESF
jgi:tetratricopeptide (TPR) repeat protein